MRFLNFISDTLYTLTGLMKGHAHSYVDVKGVDSDIGFFTHNDDLVSIIEIHGRLKMIDSEEFTHVLEHLNTKLASLLKKSGTNIDFVFKGGDAIGAEEEIKEMLAPLISTAKRFKMNLEPIIQEKGKRVLAYTSSEKCYLVVWTRFKSLSRNEQKNARKNKREMYGSRPIIAKNSIKIQSPSEDLASRHYPVVSTIQSMLTKLEVFCNVMKTHDVITTCRRENSQHTDTNYKPRLPGDKALHGRSKTNNKADLSHLLYPLLGEQIFPDPVGEIDNAKKSYIKVGNRLYSSSIVTIPPENPLNFNALFQALLAAQIPYRFRMTISGNGLQDGGIQFKNGLNRFFSVTDIMNNSGKPYQAAIDVLHKMQAETNATNVGIQFCATTWIEIKDYPNIQKAESAIVSRAQTLSRTLQGWGTMDTAIGTGDPLYDTTATLPGMSVSNPGELAVYPLTEILVMLPLFRPARIWESGGLLLRSKDGKTLPFQPASSKQKAWSELVVGPMRFGKSVWQAARNMALLISPGITKMPFIMILDIGPSSKGFVDLVKNSLPESLQYLAQSYVITNTKKYAVNPGDTHLGARRPTPHKRSFLQLFLGLLVSDKDGNVHDAVNDLLLDLIDFTYKRLSDRESPHLYEAGAAPLVDEYYKKQGKSIPSRTPWWVITDNLFKDGEYKLSSYAQRFAVPITKDFLSFVNDPVFESMYGKKIIDGTQTPIEYVTRKLASAIKSNEMLSRPTHFDISEARIVSLDLQEVCPKDNKKQTALMYMLGREILVGRLLIKDTDLEDMPPLYKEYHISRIKDFSEAVKSLTYDEFHRTSGIESLEKSVELDTREGPKFGMITSLASHSINDFSDVMVDLTSNKIMLGNSNPKAAENAAKRLGFNATATLALRSIKKPDKDGSTAIYDMDIDAGSGKLTQEMTLTLGPMEIWAYSTTKDDRILRDELYNLIGVNESLKKLALHFPETTCAEYVERVRSTSLSEIDSEDSSIIMEMALEIANDTFNKTVFSHRARRVA